MHPTEQPLDPTVRRHAAQAGGPGGGFWTPAPNLPPAPTADPRPEMTEKELSFHTVQAAARARSAAEEQAIPPASRHALAAAAAAEDGGGFLDIAGLTARPVSIGAMWVVELAEPYLQQMPPSRAGDQAVLVYILTHTPTALSAALEGRFGDIVAAAIALAQSGTVSAEQGQLLDEWYTGECERLKEITGSGGELGSTPAKKSPAASRS